MSCAFVSRYGCFWLAALAVTLAPTVGTADTITVSGTVNFTTAYTLYGSDTTVNLSIPQFNPSLGTLTSIRVGHTLSFVADSVSTASGGTLIPPYYIAGWNWSEQYTSTFSGPGFVSSAHTVLSASGGGNYTSFNQTAQVTTPVVNVPGSTVTIDLSSPAVLAQYIGTGTVPASFRVVNSTYFPPLPFDYSPGGFNWTNSTLTAAGTAMSSGSPISLDYNFTPSPVPEPACVVAVAAVGLGLLRWQMR